MTRSNLKRRHIIPILIVTMLAGLALAVTGCDDFGFGTPLESETTTEGEVITTEDVAILAVNEHLLNQAESYQAKVYLADFYATCDQWSAGAVLLGDGSKVWYVTVDMTDIEVWEARAYWQQACWLAFQDGKVIPSNRFQANALRIEADLAELNLQPQL